MNIYGIIILGAFLGEYFLNLFADYLNMKTLHSPLPTEFEGVYAPDIYKKSQEYTRVRTSFGILTASVNLTILLLFWFLGGFNFLDHIVRGWQLTEIWRGMLYVGILLLLKAGISLPFSIYSTFVIEERFGFNKTTPAIFVLDLFKGLLLSVLLGGPLLLGILLLFYHIGSSAWIYCWIVASLFILFLQFIAPTWIMPLFNKFTPLEQGELRNAILAYAKSVRFSLRDVFIMDGSKRSSKSNAFFTGFGRNKRIALFDTLIQKHTIPELVAVLAHEIGHYKKKHILQNIIIGILHMGLMFFLLSLFISRRELFDAFFMAHVSIYAGLIFFGMLYSPLEFLISLIMNIISRKNEYEADKFAITTIDQREAMVDALKKLSVDNLSHLTPHPLYVTLNYSHPTVLERIQAIRKN